MSVLTDHAKTMSESALEAAMSAFTRKRSSAPGPDSQMQIDVEWRMAIGQSHSVLQIQACELLPIQQYDLTLVVADEAENAETVQP